MWGVHDGMGWWMLFGSLWFVLFWAAVIYVVVWAARGTRGGESHPEAPIEILKRRYARGEIDKEEFERMRRDLEA
jgi:putative membrane protein